MTRPGDPGAAPAAVAAPVSANGDDATSVVAALKEADRQLVQAGPTDGRAWCTARTQVLDTALTQLSAAFVASHRLAVVAVGGYGRGEMCPSSDVDVLLLHDRLSEPVLEQAVRAIVYPLWDAGLRVGYAVRDRREALGALDDLDTATAMIDLRTVAGDVAFVQLVRAESLRRLRRRPEKFLTALREADTARRARAGDAAEVLEPDLKNGAGGLRDVQSLRWAAAALVGTPGLDPLVPAGYLGAPDRPRLVRAEQELLATRVALQRVAGKTDTLRLDLHTLVAGHLGLEEGEHGHDGARDDGDAAHRLLTAHFLAARTIDHIHRRAWALIDADLLRGRRRRGRPTQQQVDGFELVDGSLRLPQGAAPVDVASATRLLAVLADTGAVLDRGSASRLRAQIEHRRDEPVWSDRDRRRFLSVLWRGRIALPALAELDDVGLVTALLPEWAPLRGRAQRNPFHRYALDRHAWHCAAELGELVRRESWATETLGEVGDREGLLLGALFHDVGKAVGEPHSRTGRAVAQQMARRMGASAATIELVGRLVELHLLLPDAARKRDVNDPALAHEVAAEVGDRSTLACLQLLATADGRATGPTAWSDWTATLVRTLVTKVRAVLEQQSPDEVADGAVVTVREAQELAVGLGSTPEDVRGHLAQLPSRYAAAVSPRAVVRHTLMASSPPGPTEVRTRVTPGETDPDGLDGVDELDVVALDSHGWFAKVAGVLALHGGSILAADAFAREDGLAIDTFKVRTPEDVSGSWWVRVEGDLAEAAAGRLAVRARVARKARSDDHRVSRLPEVTTKLVQHEDPSGQASIIEVRALDRIGVLYAIATAFAELELDITVARIQTVGHEVMDVFYLCDGDGRPLGSDHLHELELAVTAEIDALDQGGDI